MAESTKTKILVMNNEPKMGLAMQGYLGDQYTVISSNSWLEGRKIFFAEQPSLVIVASYLSDASGLGIMAEVKSVNLETPVLLIASNDNMEHAIAAIKQGLFDYVVMPMELNRLNSAVLHILEKNKYESSINEGLIYNCNEMRTVLTITSKAATSNVSVLLLGESGTGKELIAQMVHAKSSKASGPFIAINCAAVPENLLESELFGYEKGAFTGAGARKIGKIELAHHGTLFLDEIGDMPLALQAKLLRVLEKKQVERLGGIKPIDVNLRLVSATNKSLEQMIEAGKFRLDLYFRLAVISIKIPPLRNRGSDIQLLAEVFLKEFSEIYKKSFKVFTHAALDLLQRHPWPGNIRELKNVIERTVVLHEGTMIEPWQLSLSSSETDLPIIADDWKRKKQMMEREEIRNMLKLFGGNKTKTAQHMSMSLRNMQLKIKKYNIQEKEYLQ